MIPECGKCKKTFFLLFKDDTIIVCPYCHTVYKQRDNQWVCEYRLTLDPNLIQIPLNDIVIQKKGRFKDVSLELLIESIKEKGLLYPVIVQEKGPKKYILIDGIQRFIAVKTLG